MDKTLLHKTLFHLFDISWTVKDALVIGGILTLLVLINTVPVFLLCRPDRYGACRTACVEAGYDEAERHDGACRCRHSGWTTLPETVE